MLICRPYITRNGQRIPPPPGKKAWCFEVSVEEHQAYLDKKKGKDKEKTKEE